MQKLKLDLTLLAVESFDAAPYSATDTGGPSDNCSVRCGGSARNCFDGTAFAHQNDTMPEKDPDAPDRSTQKEQQRDPGLQSYRSGGEGGPASDPDQNIIIEDDPRYRQPKEKGEK